MYNFYSFVILKLLYNDVKQRKRIKLHKELILCYTFIEISGKKGKLYMEIFNNDDYKFISNFVEQKIPVLKESKNFEKDYLRLNDAIEELERTLTEEQKRQLDEIIQLFYKTEEYYFAFSYTLGMKYGEELKRL